MKIVLFIILFLVLTVIAAAFPPAMGVCIITGVTVTKWIFKDEMSNKD